MRGLVRVAALAMVLLGVWRVGGSAATSEHLEVLLAEMQVTPLPAAAPPPFKLDDLDGKSLALGDLRGRPALLYFWATW